MSFHLPNTYFKSDKYDEKNHLDIVKSFLKEYNSYLFKFKPKTTKGVSANFSVFC